MSVAGFCKTTVGCGMILPAHRTSPRRVNARARWHTKNGASNAVESYRAGRKGWRVSRDTYHRVYQRIWREPWSHEDRYVALYLLTCEHRTFEGIYRLPLAYAAHDLGMNLKPLRSSIARLSGAEFCEYDESAGVVWICKALKAQSPNEKQIAGAARKVLELPPTPLVEQFTNAARTFCPRLAELIEAGS